ncbi:MAG TPA: hypothetical protein VMB85_06055 [Bryobacteraceae bacterium]|nr:hypothetical protein [Bryobacteraceae bacterium]
MSRNRLLHILPVTRLTHMEPIHDPFQPQVPTTGELIRDLVQTGQQMFSAGQRLLDDLDRLRGSAAGESEWRIEFKNHPYLWIAGSVGACLLLAAMFRPRE